MPHSPEEINVCKERIQVIVADSIEGRCGQGGSEEVGQEGKIWVRERIEGIEEVRRHGDIDEDQEECQLHKIIYRSPYGLMAPEEAQQDNEGDNGQESSKGWDCGDVVADGVDRDGGGDAGPGGLGELSWGGDDGWGIQYLQLYGGGGVCGVVVEDELIEPVAVVDDGVVEVLVGGGGEQSGFGDLFDLDDFIYFLGDVDWLAELHLDGVLVVVHELVDGVS